MCDLHAPFKFWMVNIKKSLWQDEDAHVFPFFSFLDRQIALMVQKKLHQAFQVQIWCEVYAVYIKYPCFSEQEPSLSF